MANRILAYTGSAFLILLSALSWIGAVMGGNTVATDPWEQVGHLWAIAGFAASGLVVFLILTGRTRGVLAKTTGTLLNVVNILIGFGFFAAGGNAELAMRGGATIAVALGCLVIVAGLLNIGAIWQPIPSRPQAEGDSRPEQGNPDANQHNTASRQRPTMETLSWENPAPGVGADCDPAAPRRGRKRALAIICFCGLGVATIAWLRGGPSHLSADEVFKSSSPAVVKVLVRDTSFQVVGQGSGFYVSADGRIVTNYHVIQNACFATVVETDGTIRGVDSVIATDPDADLAILKVSRSGGPSLRLAAAIPKIGARVYALGNPQGFTDTLSEGIVSGLRNDDKSVPAIQTTAAISPGSSGGPLIGEDGAVVGVTAATWTKGQALNFAVPATRVGALLNAPAEQAKSVVLVHADGAKQSTDKVLEDAWERMDREDYRGALAELEPLRESEARNPMYLYTLAELHYSLDNYEQSVELLNRAIGIIPQLGDFYAMRGEALCGLKRWGEAVTDFWRAAHMGAKSARSYTSAGRCYIHLGQTGRAEECFRYALKLDARYRWAYLYLAQLHEQATDNVGDSNDPFAPVNSPNSDLEAAIQILADGIAQNPGDAMLYLEAGYVYAQMKNYDRAMAMCNNAIRFDPGGVWGKDAQKMIELLSREQFAH